MTDDDLIAASRAAFMEEASEMLAQLEASLLVLTSTTDSDAVAAAFRAAHTIKGSAGLFGCSAVVEFTHDVETVLDEMREGRVAASDELVALLLQSRDQIERLLEKTDLPEVPAALAADGARIASQLRQMIGQAGHGGATASSPAAVVPASAPNAQPVPNAGNAAEESAMSEGHNVWHISLRFKQDALRNGLDPAAFLRYLPTVGTVLATMTLAERIPALDALDPESCYMGFEIRLQTEADKSQIERVFEFAFEDCELRLLPPRSKLADYVRLIDELNEDRARLGEILLAVGAITAHELADVVAAQSAQSAQSVNSSAAAPQLMGEMLIERAAVAPEVVQAAVGRQQALRDKKSEEQRFLRVSADKLDRLIDLIGELVIAGSGARLVAAQEQSSRSAEAALRICSLVEAARDGALQLRMVQIGETFARFKRIVHDVSRSLGKDIELSLSGGDTELDKSMVEMISDPLMHLVRNSLDHGIEPRAERIQAGKSAQGQLSLFAYHDSGSIVIEVADDGRGLNRERILAKAIERGLISREQTLTDADVYNLIFLPGFSTAEQVTNISGRGVGMDVVKRNIAGLRGQVQVTSEPGRGTTVQIRLPLTLAIIDGFLVAVGGAHYIVPLDMVVECIETPAEANAPGVEQAGYFKLRSEVLPFLRIGRLFGLEDGSENCTPARQSVVVVKYGSNKIGLVVDKLLGEYQTVIKPLGRLFAALRGIAGSTILGSGEVALILDVPALVGSITTDRTSQIQRQPRAAAALH